MRDSITLERLQLLHPAIAQEAINCIEAAEAGFPTNVRIRVVQGLRTFEEQNALFAKRPRVTKAKGGQSYHNYGLALDFAIMYDKDSNGTFEELSWDTARDFDKDGIIDWQEVVKQFTDAGWEWGGAWRTFKDLPHVQKNFGYNWRALLAKYEAKDFIPGTKYVNL